MSDSSTPSKPAGFALLASGPGNATVLRTLRAAQSEIATFTAVATPIAPLDPGIDVPTIERAFPELQLQRLPQADQ